MRRRFGLPLAVICSAVGMIAAEPGPTASALTEADALRIGLARPEIASLVDGSTGPARAERLRTLLRENPTFAYQREQADGAPSAQEDYYTVNQSFETRGRRSRRRRAAEARLAGAEAMAGSTRAERAAGIREAFYAVLAADRRLEARLAWIARFEDLATVVARREKAGEASAYDRRRLESERLRVVARREAALAEREHEREELAALLAEPGSEPAGRRPLAGELLPDPLPATPADLLARLLDRPDLAALDHQVEASRIDQALARGTQWKSFSLTAGAKIVDTPAGDGSGFLFSVAVPLPLSDRGQADRIEADALLSTSQARSALARREAEGKVRGLFLQARRLESSARLAREGATASAAELLPLARSTYEAGETGILELLDAERSVHEAELDAIDLEAAARRACIELDQALGEPR